MCNPILTGLLYLLFSLVAGLAQAQTCSPKYIPASTPDSQLQDNGDGTVTDTQTGLMWKQCSEGQSGNDCSSGMAEAFEWQSALQWAQVVNNSGGFAGFTDWRVPNIKELSSLVERQCAEPAINLMRFPNTPTAIYISASAVTGKMYGAWFVNLRYGAAHKLDIGQDSALRLVRSAP